MKLVKCINCNKGESIEEIINNKGQIVYKCNLCGKVSPQAISLDSRLKFDLTPQGELYHFSVGLIVRNDENDILMAHRRQYDFSWSLIFGHIHNGETPKDTVIRELIEETGLKAEKPVLKFKKLIDTTCRTGIKKHLCYVYELRVPSKSPLITNSESEELVWVKVKDIQNRKYKPIGKSTEAFLKELITFK